MTKSTNDITYEVIYTGALSGTGDVYLHYGQENWTNVCEKKMRTLKTSCKTEITLPANCELNFCFRNDCNTWDNNSGHDYCYIPSSKITYGDVCITPKTTTKTATSSTKTTAAKTATSKTITTKTARTRKSVED